MSRPRRCIVIGYYGPAVHGRCQGRTIFGTDYCLKHLSRLVADRVRAALLRFVMGGEP